MVLLLIADAASSILIIGIFWEVGNSMSKDFSYIDGFFDTLPKVYAMPLPPLVLTGTYVSPAVMISPVAGIAAEALWGKEARLRAKKEGYAEASALYEERFQQTNRQYEMLKAIFDDKTNSEKLLYQRLYNSIQCKVDIIQGLDTKLCSVIDTVSKKYHLSAQDKQNLIHSSQAHLRVGKVLGFLPFIIPFAAGAVKAIVGIATGAAGIAATAGVHAATKKEIEKEHRNAYMEVKKIYIQKIQLMEKSIDLLIEDSAKKLSELNVLNHDMITYIKDLGQLSRDLIIEISEYELKLSYLSAAL